MIRALAVAVLLSLLSLAVPPAIRAGTWTSTGPQFKTVKAIAVSPQHSTIIYAAAFGWGVFKSTDAGNTWQNYKTGMVNTYARSILVLSDTVVYVGTNGGIYKTTNGGVSFTLLVSTPFSIRSLARDPLTGSIYGASYGSGLYKSTNDGSTWSQITVIDPNTLQTLSHLWSVAVFGRDSLYVGGSILDIPAGNGGALFSSVNGGATWLQVQYPTAIRSSIHAIAISPTSPATSFIVGTAAKGVYLSTNAGVGFTNIDGDGTTTHPITDHQINSVAIRGGNYYASTDSIGGFFVRPVSDVTNGWTPGTGLPGAPAQVNEIAIDPLAPSTIFVGTDQQGVFRSANAGGSWGASRNGMMGVGAMSMKFSANGTLFLGTDFGDGMWRSADSGATWTRVDSLATVDPVASVATTSNPLILYAGTTGAGVHKSTDGGLIWKVTDTTTSNHFVRPILVDPADPNVVYAGTSAGMFKTTNGGTSWFAINNGIASPTTSVRALDLVLSSPATILAGTDSNYLYRTTNAGNSWVNITSANGFLPQDDHIRSVVIDQGNPARVFAGADSGRIYRSLDGGQNWSLIFTITAGNSVRRIVLHPSNPAILFAATFGQGVFVSVDSGYHWVRSNAGLGDSTEYTMMVDNASPLGLYAGSHATGLYRTTYQFVNHPPLLAPIGNKSVYPNASLSFAVSATDPDGTIPVLAATGLPSGSSFVPAGSGTAQFSWIPSAAQIGSHSVLFTASDGSLIDSEQVTITVLDSATSVLLSVPVDAGWNMVSLPDVPTDRRKIAVFPTASSAAFGYAGSYVKYDTLEVGRGYWVNFSSPATVDIGGARIVQDTLALASGWNIIGSLSTAAAAASVQPLAPMTLITGFFGYQGGYFLADTLRPGRAYWVRASQAGSLVLTGSGATGIVPSSTVAPRQGSEHINTLVLTDARGRSAQLLFSGEPGAMDENFFQLPPAPPEGAFDVRFAGNHSAEVISASSGKIVLSGVAFPATLRWHVAETTRRYVVSAGGGRRQNGEWVIAGDGELRLSDPSTSMLTVAASDAVLLPGTPQLDQNYPNPFNPSTTIRFRLYDERRVVLAVYDLLGRVVETLVDDTRQPGEYTVAWNAASYASGLYYYRLTASPTASNAAPASTEFRPMIILK